MKLKKNSNSVNKMGKGQRQAIPERRNAALLCLAAHSGEM